MKRKIGEFTSEWSDGEIITTDLLSFDPKSGEVVANCSKDTSDHGGVIAEYITLTDGTKHLVCLHCHEYILKTVVVEDNTGNGVHEELECMNPMCDDF